MEHERYLKGMGCANTIVKFLAICAFLGLVSIGIVVFMVIVALAEVLK